MTSLIQNDIINKVFQLENGIVQLDLPVYL